MTRSLPAGTTRVALVSLGCPKNLVDSENLLGSLDPERFALCVDPGEADVAIVNTCGFLEAARQESIETILELARLKESGNLTGLVVTGCIVPRHREELEQELPEVDAFVGFADYAKLPEICLRAAGHEEPGSWRVVDPDAVRLPLTPGHTAYLKIGDGCSNPCSFCVIPKIRGKLRSRSLETVVEDARRRAEGGAVELNLIGQDTTDWGKDLYGERRLHVLMRELSRIDGVRWLRLMYAYPAHVTPALIEEMAANERVVKYLDMPVQHASGTVLRRMKRGFDRPRLLALIDRFRDAIPGLALRTTIIVGYPGETTEEFAELLDFLREVRFERLGAFCFSREEGTPSFDAPDQIPSEVAEQRRHEVMTLQQEITFEANRAKVGREVEVLVEEPTDDAGVWLGRTASDAPEIDGVIRLFGEGLRSGTIGLARVSEATGYDLEGAWIRAI